MTISDSTLGNIMTRLQGLKNISGRSQRRRVLPGAEFLQDLEDIPQDVSKTANTLPDFSAFLPDQINQPENDLGGELTSQNYDVRANIVNSPEEDRALAKLGKYLWNNFKEGWTPRAEPQNPDTSQVISPVESTFPSAQHPFPPESPPIETEQVDISQGIPPVTPSQEMNLESSAGQVHTHNEIKEPGTYVKLGSADQIYNNSETSPELKAEIERIFGTEITPEKAKEINEFEKVLDAFINKLEGVDIALTTREKELLAKVESKNLSTSEQISMALALVAPALIGGLIAGKQGFAGGLAAGGQNVSKILSGREKEINEAQKILPEIALEKSNIAKEKLNTTQQANEIKKKIAEIPNEDLKKLFSRDGKILNGKLVLDTGNPLLPLKSTAIRTENDFKNFREKIMPQLTQKISSTNQGLKLLDNLQDLIDYSQQEKKGLLHDYISLYDPASKIVKAFIPATRDTFRDENGNDVKISELYETYLEQLSDMYSQSIGQVGAKTAFKTYREHFKEMLPNPFTIASLSKGRTQYGTIKSQIKSVKDKFEENIVSRLDSEGIDTYPIKQLFSESKINKNLSEKKRKENRAQNAVKEVLSQ